MKVFPEAARIAQHIVACDFLVLYWAIKRSKSLRAAIAEAEMCLVRQTLAVSMTGRIPGELAYAAICAKLRIEN